MAQIPAATQSMTIAQARQVMWLRNNPRYHRPLGELLDSGYLTDDRLQWAIDKAYDTDLQDAAAVLLAWKQQAAQAMEHPPATAHPRQTPQPRQRGRAPEPVKVSPAATPVQARLELPVAHLPLTLEQARATPWPFRQERGQPMGDLVDTNRISLQDLAYAVENAWDRRVRDAAIALMAVRLNQVIEEPEGLGPLRVISDGKTYSEGQELAWTGLLGAFYGALFVVWLGLVVGLVVRIVGDPAGAIPKLPAEATPLQSTLSIGFAILLLACVYWLANRVFSLSDRMEKQIESARKGQEGEEAVEEALRQNLDGNWTLFRNLTLPGRNPADIDGVLVGPPGVWTLEVKNYTGIYANYGEQWARRTGKRWKKLKKSPSRQARNNAIRLAEFLKADGLKQFVNPAVVWVNREQPPRVKHPQTPVWTWDQLPEELGNLWQGTTMDESQHARIVEKLTDLTRRQAGPKKEKQGKR